MEILFEDKNIVVVNKPVGILSVPYEGFKGKTILGQLTEHYRKRGMIRANFCPVAVHRLDKDTSGVMIFALNEKSKNQLMNNWNKAVESRTYVALAENPKVKKDLPPQGTIDLPLAKNAYHHSYVAKNGDKTKNQFTQSAITHYKMLQQGKHYTLFELELETGRTNQIRAHLSSIGFTIAGDTLYKAKTDPCKRLCLHARNIKFTHPVTKETMEFVVSEPDSWKTFCK